LKMKCDAAFNEVRCGFYPDLGTGDAPARGVRHEAGDECLGKALADFLFRLRDVLVNGNADALRDAPEHVADVLYLEVDEAGVCRIIADDRAVGGPLQELAVRDR